MSEDAVAELRAAFMQMAGESFDRARVERAIGDGQSDEARPTETDPNVANRADLKEGE